MLSHQGMMHIRMYFYDRNISYRKCVPLQNKKKKEKGKEYMLLSSLKITIDFGTESCPFTYLYTFPGMLHNLLSGNTLSGYHNCVPKEQDSGEREREGERIHLSTLHCPLVATCH